MRMLTATKFMKSAAVTIAAGLALAACGKQQENQAPPAPEVTVQTVDSRPVPLELTYPARTFGSREVEVRARVGGIVLKRRFQEGSRVVQGQSMFLIDPEPVRARVGSARAEVAVAREDVAAVRQVESLDRPLQPQTRSESEDAAQARAHRQKISADAGVSFDELAVHDGPS